MASATRRLVAPSISMKKTNGPVDQIKIGLEVAWLATLMGCVGYVDGGYYAPPVVVPGPDIYFFGGFHERGPEVRAYGHRGYESREAAHHGEHEGRR